MARPTLDKTLTALQIPPQGLTQQGYTAQATPPSMPGMAMMGSGAGGPRRAPSAYVLFQNQNRSMFKVNVAPVYMIRAR